MDDLYTKVQFEQDIRAVEDARNLLRQRCYAPLESGVSGLELVRKFHKLDALETTFRARYAQNGRIFAALRRWKAEVRRLEARSAIPGPEYAVAKKKMNYLKLLVAKILEGTPRNEDVPVPQIEPQEQMELIPVPRVRRVLDGHTAQLRYEIERGGELWENVTLDEVKALERVHYV